MIDAAVSDMEMSFAYQGPVILSSLCFFNLQVLRNKIFSGMASGNRNMQIGIFKYSNGLSIFLEMRHLISNYLALLGKLFLSFSTKENPSCLSWPIYQESIYI